MAAQGSTPFFQEHSVIWTAACMHGSGEHTFFHQSILWIMTAAACMTAQDSTPLCTRAFCESQQRAYGSAGIAHPSSTRAFCGS
jgi:hypothetical protein